MSQGPLSLQMLRVSTILSRSVVDALFLGREDSRQFNLGYFLGTVKALKMFRSQHCDGNPHAGPEKKSSHVL